MSTDLLAWAWNVPGLSPSGRLVLMVLADTCDHAGYSPADREYLAVRTTQSPEIVQRRLSELEEAGHIVGLGKGVRLLADERAALAPLPDPDRRALHDQRVMQEMERRRLERVEHTEDERAAVAKRAEETIRALGGIAPKAKRRRP